MTNRNKQPRFINLRDGGNLLKSDRWITSPAVVGIIVTLTVIWAVNTFIVAPQGVLIP